MKTENKQNKLSKCLTNAKNALRNLSNAIEEAESLKYEDVDPILCIGKDKIDAKIKEILSDDNSQINWDRVWQIEHYLFYHDDFSKKDEFGDTITYIPITDFPSNSRDTTKLKKVALGIIQSAIDDCKDEVKKSTMRNIDNNSYQGFCMGGHFISIFNFYEKRNEEGLFEYDFDINLFYVLEDSVDFY